MPERKVQHRAFLVVTQVHHCVLFVFLPFTILEGVYLARPPGVQKHFALTMILREVEFVTARFKSLYTRHHGMPGRSDLDLIRLYRGVRQELTPQYLHKIGVIPRCAQQRRVVA